MRWNNRKAARVHFEHRHLVNIMAVDGTWRRSCVLLDVSTTGAKLEVEGATDALKTQEFLLVLSSTGLAFRRCELVWGNGTQVGVHFITEKARKRALPARRDILAPARWAGSCPS
ncbi:PilZ domain-containing protein [Bradyrhizobium forestalis]|uniref:PilZ domain-containing protein n=1 Tax=Bradyrhizobium forestalis TaxID=1419263 RepID=A0A2M8R5H9_9BRAD|nr:PilZ domain-containing protein [Bradyrhizobium forestalis]PJG53078.1 PilZ domain-containing protein [Bradyrhizobium forestalis]